MASSLPICCPRLGEARSDLRPSLSLWTKVGMVGTIRFVFSKNTVQSLSQTNLKFKMANQEPKKIKNKMNTRKVEIATTLWWLGW